MMKPFRFKQFTVHQDRCAMKIGTDGVLLGAWASVARSPTSILDIGAGTGVIALMLAQRSDAETVDAIEIDEAAYEQCVGNFEASLWADRLFCYHAGLDEFLEEINEKYELIVSNPPFYSENVSTGNESRDRARQNASLPFSELLEGASRLLAPKGLFATIVPYKEEVAFMQMALGFGLHPFRITRVRGNLGSDLIRSLMEFSFEKTEPIFSELIIETDRHRYMPEYIDLTKDFYLKL